MIKWAILFATALALASPDMARAAGPDGYHVFQGTVDVKKSLPVWSPCTMTVVINVTAGVPKLHSMSLTGSGVCAVIGITGVPATLPLDFSPWAMPDVGMNFPTIGSFPGGACHGDLRYIWDGFSFPHRIIFQDPLSDLPDGSAPPCKIRGALLQTIGTLSLP